MYRLVLTRFEENQNYEKDLADYEANQKRRNGPYGFNEYPEMPHPAKYVEARKLEVEVSDDEYAAIKKAVLELS